jgi:hypothetical protein
MGVQVSNERILISDQTKSSRDLLFATLTIFKKQIDCLKDSSNMLNKQFI